MSLEQAQPEDTTEYIHHRLSLASGKTAVFADALALIHEVSASQLRDIDRIAADALRTASRRENSSRTLSTADTLLD